MTQYYDNADLEVLAERNEIEREVLAEMNSQLIKIESKEEARRLTNRYSYQTRFWATYAQLVEILGEPTFDRRDLDKSNHEWVVNYRGLTYTIYDWKEIVDASESTREFDWHVGADDDLNNAEAFVERIKLELSRI